VCLTRKNILFNVDSTRVECIRCFTNKVWTWLEQFLLEANTQAYIQTFPCLIYILE
jgi:hypothetical protein